MSRPFAYSGYSAEEWTGHRRWAEFVTMPDGVKLAVDVVLPTGYTGAGDSATSFPVILQYTPYGRSFLDPTTGEVPVPANMRFFLRHGYAYVSADMRGTGGSDGWINLFDPSVRRDGKDLVDWIAAQVWSDGNVGMTGGSYVGWSQYAVASMQPAALKAIVPNVAGWDAFIGRPGGIFWESFIEMWSALAFSLNRSAVFPPFPIPPTPPVVDQDGDGDLRDEIPVDLDGDGWLHDDYAWPLENGPAPKYADDQPRREHHYLRAVLQHAAHPNGAPGTFDGYRTFHPQVFRDTPRVGDSLLSAEQNWAWFPDVLESGVAVLHLAGWFDPFVRSAFEMHATMRGKLPSRIVARAAYHQGISPAHAAAIGLDSADQALYSERHLTEQLRWYDRWLKGIENGVDREPPVLAYVANEGWREEEAWPPAGAKPTPLYLDSANTLASRAPSGGGNDRYLTDFTHSSGWGPSQDVSPVARVNEEIGRPAPVADSYYRNRAFMFIPPETPP
ncbi:MAG: CocE/NonD family hydrolase, partial [Gemmatimonadales bacterium]